MKNTIIIAFILFLLITFLTKKTMDALKLRSLLLSVGFPKETVNLFVAQVMFESNFNSNVAKTDNNLSGITYINRPYQHAQKGLQMPKRDTPNGIGYYAHFATLEDWAKDYKRILSFGSKPIEAKTVEDFVMRLRTNNYFGGNQQQYLAGVKKHFSTLV